MDAEPVVRRRRAESPPRKGRGRPGSGRGGDDRGGDDEGSPRSRTSRSKQGPKPTKRARSAQSSKAAQPSKAVRSSKAAQRSGSGSGDQPDGTAPAGSGALSGYLLRPDTSGPKVRLGILWFLCTIAAMALGRWAVLALWGVTAVIAARQTTQAWMHTPHARDLPTWAPIGSAVAAGMCVAAAGVGTSLGGAALIVVPIVLVGAVMSTGRKPAAAGAAVIGAVLAAVPAMSVVLITRTEVWASLFLVVAVSLYDAGYFIGAAESSSRLEGPVTGGIGLLAATFAASAFEAQPFDRATAWVAGAMMLFACPLGQMLTSAELPAPSSAVPALRRLDSYLISGPMMLAAVWALA
ncbi:MAG: hypothetical protein ACK5O2_13670 [Microthrixaceae bacterium]